MKRQYLLYSFLLIFLAWLLTGNILKDTENKPIKKRLETTGIFLFGLRNIWTISSSLDTFNKKNQLLETRHFNNSKRCESKYTYEYNKFDSLKKVTWFTGTHLTPQKIEIYDYDSLKRPYQELVYEISKLKPDTFMYEKTTWFYDNKNRKFKTVIENFSKEYPSSETVITMIDVYNSAGLLVADTFKSVSKEGGASTYVTKYTYNKLGHIKTKFGGLSGDSIYYQTNEKGQIIEEEERYKDFIRSSNKYWYDKNGNKIKTYLGIDNGKTYTSKFDKYNRILKERLSGNFLYLLMAFKEYRYEYYE